MDFTKIELPYFTYSDFLKKKYNEKVYKLPLNLPLTCPNRDGKISFGGCIFCSEKGTGYESLENTIDVKQQIYTNMSYIGEKYKAQKYIVYMQNFTNTYISLNNFKKIIKEIIDIINEINNETSDRRIVGLDIGTRPDCINDEYLSLLKELMEEHNIHVTIELGLQSVNYKTLKKINRGHSLAEFIDAVQMIKKYGFDICTHMILNLPWDDMEDTIEAAKILSALQISIVKLHSLYICDGTILGEMYKRNELNLIDSSEYINRVITFLEHLSPDIAVERLLGRMPKEGCLFCNWDMSWWKIRDEIISIMLTKGSFQGKNFDYLHGKALKGLNT